MCVCTVINNYYVCLYMIYTDGKPVPQFMWRSEANFMKLVLLPFHIGSKDLTRVPGLSSKHNYLLSHLANP